MDKFGAAEDVLLYIDGRREVNEILMWRWLGAFNPSETSVKVTVGSNDLRDWLGGSNDADGARQHTSGSGAGSRGIGELSRSSLPGTPQASSPVTAQASPIPERL